MPSWIQRFAALAAVALGPAALALCGAQPFASARAQCLGWAAGCAAGWAGARALAWRRRRARRPWLAEPEGGPGPGGLQVVWQNGAWQARWRPEEADQAVVLGLEARRRSRRGWEAAWREAMELVHGKLPEPQPDHVQALAHGRPCLIPDGKGAWDLWVPCPDCPGSDVRLPDAHRALLWDAQAWSAACALPSITSTGQCLACVHRDALARPLEAHEGGLRVWLDAAQGEWMCRIPLAAGQDAVLPLGVRFGASPQDVASAAVTLTS